MRRVASRARCRGSHSAVPPASLEQEDPASGIPSFECPNGAGRGRKNIDSALKPQKTADTHDEQ
eukprot:3044873-Prymnesium_polylepis.2